MTCVKVNRMVVIFATILSFIAAVSQFFVAGYSKQINIFCENNSNTTAFVITDDHFGTKHTHVIVPSQNDDDHNFTSSCNRLFKTYLAIGIITGFGWLLSAYLAFSMLRNLKQNENSNVSAWADEDVPTENKLPVTNSELTPGQVIVETSELPDGKTKIKEITVNADGSQTVTETIKAAKPEESIVVEPDVEKGE